MKIIILENGVCETGIALYMPKDSYYINNFGSKGGTGTLVNNIESIEDTKKELNFNAVN